MTFDIGAGAGVLINDRDATTKLNTVQVSDEIGAAEVTTFHPSRRSRRFNDGLNGGAVTAGGYLPVEYALAAEELESMTGTRSSQHVNTAPFGFGTTAGNLGVIVDTQQTQTGIDSQRDGVVALSASWQATGGIKDGVVLHSPHDASVFVRDEQFSLVATAVTVNGSFTFPATENGSGGTVTITPGDSTATVKAAIEALTGYDAVTVTGATDELLTGDQTTLNAYASSSFAGRDAALAFDGNTASPSNSWQANTGVPAWVGNDLGSAKLIAKYRLYFEDTSSVLQQPVDWTFEAADDNTFSTNLTVLDTVTGYAQLVAGWAEFTIDVPVTKRYYRLNISAISGGVNPVVREMEVLPSDDATASGAYRVQVTDPGGFDIDAVTTAAAGWSVLGHHDGVTTDDAIYNIVTTSGNGTTVDNGAATGSGWTAMLNVLYCDGVGQTLDVVLEHSANGSAWSTLGTFAQVMTEGSQVLRAANKSVAVSRYVRVVRTLGGTDSRFVYAVTFTRRF